MAVYNWILSIPSPEACFTVYSTFDGALLMFISYIVERLKIYSYTHATYSAYVYALCL